VRKGRREFHTGGTCADQHKRHLSRTFAHRFDHVLGNLSVDGDVDDVDLSIKAAMSSTAMTHPRNSMTWGVPAA